MCSVDNLSTHLVKVPATADDNLLTLLTLASYSHSSLSYRSSFCSQPPPQQVQKDFVKLTCGHIKAFERSTSHIKITHGHPLLIPVGKINESN